MSSLPIPELVESMAKLFYLGQFDEVKNILMDRENMIRTQMESLGRDALERMQGMTELERSKFEERLRDSQRECETLKEKIATLNADRESNDGARRGQEGLVGVCEDHTKMLEARNVIILELNKKLTLLENQILEGDQVVRVCQDKLKGFEERMVQLDVEVETLKQQKMEANETVEQLKHELSKFERREEKLRKKNMEACELLEQLRQQILAAEAHTMRSDEAIKKLKRKELEADRTVQKLRREVLAGEEHKKMSNRMLDKMRAKESEDVRRMQELRKQNLEASRTVEELRQQVLAAEENKKICDQAIEEIRARQLEDIRTVEELKSRHLQTSETMEELRQHILAAEDRKKISDQTIDEMKARKSEDIRTVEELSRQQYEVSRAMKELRRQKLEAYNAAEIHKRRYENLAPMAEGLASLLKVEVDDLVNLVTVEDKSLTAEGNEGLIFRVSKDGKRCLRNDSAEGAGNADVIVVVKSLGDRNLPESSWTKHGDTIVYNAYQTSSPVQSDYATAQAECNYGDQENRSRKLLDSGGHAGSGLEFRMSVSEQLMIQTCCSHELTPYRADAGVIIDIIDSDDETTEPAYISTPPNQTNKQKDYASEVSLISQKRKRSEFEIDWQKGDENIVGEASDSQILKYDDFNERTPIHNLNNRVLQRTWMFPSDMLKAFMEDDELCMNAVCALYRQQVSASKSNAGFAGIFHHFEAMSGCALAEYLIGEDPELKLRKSRAEVKEQFPCAINLCRRIATDYYENLFALYCNGDDPFFRS
ncbi:cingulin-like [Sesamum indicum]|uniref:Cingulin-like n=1 Tax=Sesamum indicum TaxID=4182 RepID=A0A8M8USE1_SESIN|nr:cingulin-like [Sesamum indicum]